MIFFCLAAYNEAKELPKLLNRIDAAGKDSGLPYTIVAYNDGSNDTTLSILKNFTACPVVVLSSDINQGLGKGLASIIEYVAANAGAGNIALFMDADNTHDPALIGHFMQEISLGADVVIASRYEKVSTIIGVPFYREVLSTIVHWFFKTLICHDIQDITCGFRCYKIEVLKKLISNQGKDFITCAGFECQIELLCNLPETMHIKEIPFQLDYRHRVGNSKFAFLKTCYNTFRLFLVLSCKKWRPAKFQAA